MDKMLELQLLNEYMTLDEQGEFSQEEFDVMKSSKKEILRKLSSSQNTKVLAIACILRVDRHAHSARMKIREFAMECLR